jgi:hypothetical protein
VFSDAPECRAGQGGNRALMIAVHSAHPIAIPWIP